MAFEVYLILVKEADDILLLSKDFEQLINVIQKARFNMNVIITTSKNWISDINFDRNLIETYKKKLLTDEDIKSKEGNRFKSDFISDVIHKQLKFKKNDQELKLQRINNALRKKKKKTELEKENEEKERMRYDNGVIIYKGVKPTLIKPQSLLVSIELHSHFIINRILL